MKIYSKSLGKIQNSKTRVKKAVGIVAMAVGLRHGSINSIPTNLSSNSLIWMWIHKNKLN